MASKLLGNRRGHAPRTSGASITTTTATEEVVQTQESQITVSSGVELLPHMHQDPTCYSIVHHENDAKVDAVEAISSTLGTTNLSSYGFGSIINQHAMKPAPIPKFSPEISPRIFALPSHNPAGQKSGHPRKADKLIIGIDFGTTYTGIAYAFASKPEDIVVIKDWGGKFATGRNDFLKVPSLIKYTNPESLDHTWGYHIDVTEPGAIRGIKLSLDPGKRDFFLGSRSPTDESANIIVQSQYTTEQDHLNKGTIDIVSDYIGSAYRSAIAQIRSQNMEGRVDNAKKEFTLTVPAIWSEQAKTSTLLAARKAHPDLRVLRPADLITEPEAAALCVFRAFSQNGMKKGDTFLLCDAGGGTVDLVSYKIKALAPKLELEQIVLPSGDAVGSMMLNNAFDKYLKDTLGESQYREFVDSEDKDYHHAMDDFEKNIKTRFNGPEEWDEDGKRYSKISLGEMTIADDPGKNIRRGHLLVTGKTLFDIFDPLVTQIEKLVSTQLKSIEASVGVPTKSVFLVGGFGASQYLQKRLKNLVSGSVKVTYPADAWAAVVRGAVLSKIPSVISVVATIAPKSYGIRSEMVFDEHEHTQEATRHKHWDDFENIWRITTMDWPIVKGQTLDRTQEWSLPFFRAIPLDYTEDDLLFDCEFEECDALFPPQYPWEVSTRALNPACKIECDFRHLRKDQLERFEPPGGRSHYLLNYELCVKPGALSSFALKFDGEVHDVADMRFIAE